MSGEMRRKVVRISEGPRMGIAVYRTDLDAWVLTWWNGTPETLIVGSGYIDDRHPVELLLVPVLA